MKIGYILLGASLFCSSPILAQSLDIKSVGNSSGTKTTQANKRVVKRPSRGMTKVEVVKKFGRPVKEMQPVGANSKRTHHRPISRWIYTNYMVVFDADYVIDTVSRRQ